jgi:hypothetical protein
MHSHRQRAGANIEARTSGRGLSTVGLQRSARTWCRICDSSADRRFRGTKGLNRGSRRPIEVTNCRFSVIGSISTGKGVHSPPQGKRARARRGRPRSGNAPPPVRARAAGDGFHVAHGRVGGPAVAERRRRRYRTRWRLSSAQEAERGSAITRPRQLARTRSGRAPRRHSVPADVPGCASRKLRDVPLPRPPGTRSVPAGRSIAVWGDPNPSDQDPVDEYDPKRIRADGGSRWRARSRGCEPRVRGSL